MPKQPVISGKALIKALAQLGYVVLRQRGSHITLSKTKGSETHKITIPLHKELAKGTLNDILSKVALWNGMAKNQLLEKL